MAPPQPTGLIDPLAQVNTYRSFVTILADPVAKDEIKRKAAYELTESFELLLSSPQYAVFLDHAINIFLEVLQEGQPMFIAEYNMQQVRKLVLEMIHRFPTNELLRPYSKRIISSLLKLMERENEENAIICLHIIIELHKQYRPPFTVELQHFLQFTKSIYRELPTHMNKIFEPRPPIHVPDVSELNLEQVLAETFTFTPIQTDKTGPDGAPIHYTLIPRSVLSLKVLQELPIIVVLLYQLFKQNVHQDVTDFIPLVMTTITLQPSPQHRASPTFNKEVFVDFMAAQIKTLSFLAYIIRIYQEVVVKHSTLLVKGMLGMLALCPAEVAHLRKDLLIATRHILATDLKIKFVPYMDRLFDDNIMLGKGWTVNESLRPLSYSMLADLIHHCKTLLPLPELVKGARLFSRNVHDETLPTGIQIMSAKVVMKLAETIIKSDTDPVHCRELLFQLMEVFVLKFKIVSKIQLPVLKSKQQAAAASGAPGGPGTLAAPLATLAGAAAAVTTVVATAATAATAAPGTAGAATSAAASASGGVAEDKKPPIVADAAGKEQEKARFAFPTSQTNNYNVMDCRNLVRTLVCGTKTVAWALVQGSGEDMNSMKLLQPKETTVFIRVMKWAMKSMDVFTLSASPVVVAAMLPSQRVLPAVPPRPEYEEKEVLEHLSGVFTKLDPQSLQELFSATIEFIVDRIYQNPPLQILVSSFLSYPTTSPIFAKVMVEYLLGHMDEMGYNIERSGLYYRIFRLVFGSVTQLPQKNEHMLRPHLHQIVNKCMDLAMTAKEPYNYFLVLRALFRSIGGGSHDLLYHEFLPLLPSLLQGLNNLQSGPHKQNMKDLFVDLCLTVPVRLSSLLPYLPMLMDPLVSALNGSQTLVNQGLRTLELCVDNLQPDFLYEHIQPVRAELMQALWRTLRNTTEQVAQVAFRVLGKFGGSNRKMMIEPQKLYYNEHPSVLPSLVVYFADHNKAVHLCVDKIIDTAFAGLKTNTTDLFYKRQCWEIIKCYLVVSLHLDDDEASMEKIFTHPSFTDPNCKITPIQGMPYKSPDKQARATYQKAISAMLAAAATKDMRPVVLSTMVLLVSYYTMVAISQQAGPFSMTSKQSSLEGMDPLVLIDALADVMGNEEKEWCKSGHLALVLILETATDLLGSCQRACQLPLMEYLAEKMCSLCYEQAWYSKLGGCIAIKFLYERLDRRWVCEHLFMFLKALLFVMLDLTGEVSNGAIDMAKSNLEAMLKLCAAPVVKDGTNDDVVNAQQKSLSEVTHELVRQVTSPNTLVREQAMHSLEVLAKIQCISVTQVIEPHKNILEDMIPPKKHQLQHQPPNAQMGIIAGTTFCTTLEPRLFTIDLNVKEHSMFFNDLVALCEEDDASLLKLPSYKLVSSFAPLRKLALQALAACHYIHSSREKIFGLLYKAMEVHSAELQQTGFQCMKKFIAGFQIDKEQVHSVMRPLLTTLGDYRNLTLNSARRLSYLTQLFPTSFSEKLCDQLLQHLEKLMETSAQARGLLNSNTEYEQKTVCLIDIFHQIPTASQKYIEPLCRLVLQAEKSMLVQDGSPFRGPLVCFLLRYPEETVSLVLQENNIKDYQWSHFLLYLIRHKEGKVFRDVLEASSQKLINMAVQAQQHADKSQLQYQSIRITSLLIKYNDQWLVTEQQLVNTYTQIWCSDHYQELHKKLDGVEMDRWNEPKLLVKILLHYFCHNTNNIDLLFHLLRALCDRFIPSFQFLREFLENTVAQSYTIEWKRSAFFRFVALFRGNTISQDLKAKILQLIIIPCFTVSFERGEGDKLVADNTPIDQDSPQNLVSVFISEVIDPENPFCNSDAVRILQFQLSCLFVEYAINKATKKRQASKLQRLMAFAWPCLLGKSCVDPATVYHGHLLLVHIIIKFSINKKIILQVFRSLLKAHAMEARSVVRQALDILTPAIPTRMEDGHTMLTHWTKKIIAEEGHSMQQLFHVLQLVVRHFKVYYPVRHHLLHHMVNSVQRMGFSTSSTIEHRRLAVELAEVIIKWELQRIKDEAERAATKEEPMSTDDQADATSSEEAGGAPDQSKKQRHPSTPGTSTAQPAPQLDLRPINRPHAESVVNLLIRLACTVHDVNAAVGTPAGSPGEQLSRRCITLLKTALQPDVLPPFEVKLNWFEKLLSTVDSGSANFANICTALELLTYLFGVMKKEQVLASVKPLQRGLSACISSSNMKVVRLVHSLLSRLMTIFPTEPTTSNVASKYEELESLYACVGKFVFEGLANYEKNTAASPSTLYGTVMMLKAACVSNPSYIDRLITPFMRVLHRMAKEHLSLHTPKNNNQMACELLILSLDLVKNRVGVLGNELRKTFIGTILVGLIEKSTDIRVLKAITKMVDDWVKMKSPMAVNLSPSLREKAILLVKLMQNVEKRFSDNIDFSKVGQNVEKRLVEHRELNAQFLEIVDYIYRDEVLKTSELTAKLEPAFMAGLRCVQPTIRAKFFEVFDANMKQRLYDRLLYIVCSQNWETIGAHYWIKQCIELLLVTTSQEASLKISSRSNLLPGISELLSKDDYVEKALFNFSLKDAPMDTSSEASEQLDKEASEKANPMTDVMDMDLSSDTRAEDAQQPSRNRKDSVKMLINKSAEFIEKQRELRTYNFLKAVSHLCHMDTSLAESVWLDLFPKIWGILSEKQQSDLRAEIVPFVGSSTHYVQKDCLPSALGTFLEAMSRCSPPITMKPSLMVYLGRSHNLWHRMALGLEQMAFENGNNSQLKTRRDIVDCYEFEPTVSPQQEVLDSLAEMYSLMCEEDLWAGVWQKHAHFRETNVAVMYEQQGFFEQAQQAYEAAVSKFRSDFAASPAPFGMNSETKLWEQHWVRCAKELNQWELLLEYGSNEVTRNPFLVLESSWRIPNWSLMKESLSQVDMNCQKEMMWKVNLYRSFLAICFTEEQHLTGVERYVELARNHCLREWRRLPRVVSHIHMQYLQAAQQVMEVQEACTMRTALIHNRNNAHHDMKGIIKTWRIRLPVIADDLSHWNDIFTWRKHHYAFVTSHFEGQSDASQGKIGVHASAQAIIHFGKIACKQNLTGVCLDSLSRIYTIPNLPVVNCFQTIRQQVKCYVQMATTSNKNDLQECLEVIEPTNLKYFTREMSAEFFALKGMLLSQLGRSDEAHKNFSAAVQLHDTLTKAWSLWGDYLETVFTRDSQRIELGVNAIVCFLHACRNQNEIKSRRHLAKVLWLLSYDNEQLSLASAVSQYSSGVPPAHWLPWIPQLLTCLMRREGEKFLTLVSQVGRLFAQAVYFPVRTLYFTLKFETLERSKVGDPAGKQAAGSSQTPAGAQSPFKDVKPKIKSALSPDSQAQEMSSGSQAQAGGRETSIRAPLAMWRCTHIMRAQREVNLTVLSTLEGIHDQITWFRENWYEEVSRQLRQGLAKCLAIAFENRGAVSEAQITNHTLNFVKKVVSTFGIGLENINTRGALTYSSLSSAASESLASRARATVQDPVFHLMKTQFKSDFDFSLPGSMKLQHVISKLRKWIAILESKLKTLPKSFLMEEKCRFLSSFCPETADIELPGEFLLPKHAHYYVRIAKFMPRVDIVQKHNTALRRMYIRGHNGKIYPFLVVLNESGTGDARREERVLQLLRMLNHYLAKQKETARRFLNFTVPRVVAVGPQMRLIEDNPASISLLDIYKQGCQCIGMEHDAPIMRYYDRLAAVQARGSQASHQVLRDILKEVQNSMIPRSLLRDWATRTFASVTDYWAFRKMFTLQLSLACFAEYVLHLTRLNPDMMYIHQDSGLVSISYFKFDVDDATGDLDSNRPVPFRLTPNIMDYLNIIWISGPLTASMMATARCLSQPKFRVQTILRAVLRDEMIAGHKKKQEDSQEQNPPDMEGDLLISMVTRAVTAIMSRLNTLASFDNADSKVGTLVSAANSPDNLCRMDPAWHPWL